MSQLDSPGSVSAAPPALPPVRQLPGQVPMADAGELPPAPPRGRRGGPGWRPGPTAATGWACFVATLAFVYPLVWLVSASLKPQAQVFDNRLVPQTVQLEQLRRRLGTPGRCCAGCSTRVIVGLMSATAVTLSSALVAFGFAYFRFPGCEAPLFGLVLATMMLPGAVTMIPVYLIWNQLGMVDTQVPLWAQNLFGSAFYIFLHAPVLPRRAARAVRGGARRRRQLPADVLADRAAAVPARAHHRLRLRAPGQLVRPDEAADLPADPGLLHHAARPEADRRRLRACRGSTTGRSPWPPAWSPPCP